MRTFPNAAVYIFRVEKPNVDMYMSYSPFEMGGTESAQSLETTCHESFLYLEFKKV
jgi:hypothetical protein